VRLSIGNPVLWLSDCIVCDLLAVYLVLLNYPLVFSVVSIHVNRDNIYKGCVGNGHDIFLFHDLA
jgi:hypothetical protein